MIIEALAQLHRYSEGVELSDQVVNCNSHKLKLDLEFTTRTNHLFVEKGSSVIFYLALHDYQAMFSTRKKLE